MKKERTYDQKLRAVGKRAQALMILARTDETKRDAFEDVSVGDGSIKCAVCEQVQPKEAVYVWVYVAGGKSLCLPCIGAGVGAERAQ